MKIHCTAFYDMAHKQSQFVYTNKFMTMAAYSPFSKLFNKQNIFLMGLKNRKFLLLEDYSLFNTSSPYKPSFHHSILSHFVIQCMILGKTNFILLAKACEATYNLRLKVILVSNFLNNFNSWICYSRSNRRWDNSSWISD